MDAVDQAILGLHVLGALVWVGGSVALGILVAPTLRRSREASRSDVASVSRAARRLSWVMWPGLALAIVTGLHNLAWYLPAGYDPTSAAGQLLTAKFALVVALVGVAGAHTFWAGPRARRLREAEPPQEVPRSLQRWNAGLGALTTVLGLAVVAVGFLLAGSGP